MAQFTEYTGTVTGQNGSLITALDTALVTGQGWDNTMAGGGANKKAYKQAGGNGFYLRVDDAGPGAGGAKEARILGYEAMTDVDTGTGLFPSAAQMANGLFARKSASADATARSYKIWADDRTFYMFISTGDWATVYFAFGFGDFYSLLSGDGYRTMIIGRNAENSSATANESFGIVTVGLGATIGHYFARGHTGLGGSVQFNAHGDGVKGGAGLAGTIPFTNPSNAGLYVSPLWICDPTTAPANGIRGRFRGLWQPLHVYTSFVDGDTFSGTGDLAGKTFEITGYTTGSATGCAAIETSNTLETN